MAEEATPTALQPPAIDLVICTYNRASCLDAVLAVLARQTCNDAVQWRVLVVDNASTDDTAETVAIHRAKNSLPKLRYVFEPTLGLTTARLRGVRETTAPWIAFIDDDNFPDPSWLATIARAIRRHGDAGGIDGRVVPDWERQPPAHLKEFGFCYAFNSRPCACSGEWLVSAHYETPGQFSTSGFSRHPSTSTGVFGRSSTYRVHVVGSSLGEAVDATARSAPGSLWENRLAIASADAEPIRHVMLIR